MPSHDAGSFKINVGRMRERALRHIILPEVTVAACLDVIAAHADQEHRKAIEALCLSHERLRAEVEGMEAMLAQVQTP